MHVCMLLMQFCTAIDFWHFSCNTFEVSVLHLSIANENQERCNRTKGAHWAKMSLPLPKLTITFRIDRFLENYGDFFEKKPLHFGL